MQIEVDTPSFRGLADVVRRAGAALDGYRQPAAPDLDAVAASDAVRMLLRVVHEQRRDVAVCLRGTAALVETAAADYARTESQAVR